MDSRKAIVVQDGCSVCDYVKSVVKEREIEVEIIDASTKEGSDYADKLNIKRVPSCLVITPGEEGEMTRQCTVEEFKELLDGKKK